MASLLYFMETVTAGYATCDGERQSEEVSRTGKTRYQVIRNYKRFGRHQPKSVYSIRRTGKTRYQAKDLVTSSPSLSRAT